MVLIDEKLLRAQGKTDDLSSLVKIALVVDTSEQSLSALAALAPNLAFLNLSYSHIAAISELGSFYELHILLLDSCNLENLDGMFLMPALEKISLANNKISELSPLMDSASITYLNLAKN